MKKLSKHLIAILMLFSTSIFAEPFVAVGPGTITYLENGWFGEGFALHFTVGLAGCPAPPTEFGLLPSHPQYKEIVALMMIAYSNNESVQLVADSNVCILGARTKIVSIRLSR